MLNDRIGMRAVLLISALFIRCGTPQISVREVEVPAAAGSAEPSVEVGGDGRAYLSWIEAAGAGRHALRFSVWEQQGWSVPRTVAEGSDWFVNWADFPSVTALDDGTLAAHWLRMTDGGPEGYGVALSFSRDGGMTWSEPLCPHDDSPTEHGFVSNVPLPGGRMATIWLDGREMGAGGHGHEGHGGPMTLRTAIVNADGRVEREARIDERVCDCCQTSAARIDDGTLIVAYRDRSAGEIRDIAVSRFDGGQWSEPIAVHADRWVMPGCPVNGPALAVAGKLVAVAWFTAAGSVPTPRVRIAFSRDGGRSFGAPAEVDAARPEGRVDVVFVDNEAALVTWIGTVDGSAQLLARRVALDGSLGPRIPVASTSTARASGFPRAAAFGPTVLIAWTEAGDQSKIRSAVLRHAR